MSMVTQETAIAAPALGIFDHTDCGTGGEESSFEISFLSASDFLDCAACVEGETSEVV